MKIKSRFDLKDKKVQGKKSGKKKQGEKKKGKVARRIHGFFT